MSDQSTTGDPMASFGPNEWLVDELYHRFLTDKSSVDKAWWAFFEDYQPQDGEPKPAANGKGAGDGDGDGGDRSGVKSPSTSGQKSAGQGRATGGSNGQTATPTETTSAPESAATTAEKPAAPAARAQQPARTPRDIPQPKESGPVNDAVIKPLRGATARVVTNMESSLGVPTATSVRAVPAKLLIDNRVVINNHLARSRGGKVSYTHIIGYAMVKALKLMPQMNYGFVEQNLPTSTSVWPSTCRSPTAAAPSWCPRSSRPSRWTSCTSGPPTRTWSARPVPTS